MKRNIKSTTAGLADRVGQHLGYYWLNRLVQKTMKSTIPIPVL